MATDFTKPLTILYVDDEPQALKWFIKAFDGEYNALTAGSVDEALALIEKGIDNFAVLITDQRMPDKTGVDLLAAMRRKHPQVVRILTTAYSDMNSAIESINTGAVYRYIVKPWNLNEVRVTVRQAANLFQLQSERDLLVREKLSVLQRIIVADRVQALAVFATGLTHYIRNSMTALMYFLDLLPSRIREETSQESMKHPEFWNDIWSMALQQSHRILKIIGAVADVVVQPSGEFDAQVSIVEALRKLESEGKVGKLDIVGGDGLKPLRANHAMFVKLLAILLARSRSGSAESDPIDVRLSEIEKIWDTPGLKVHLSGKGPGWSSEKMAGLFTPFCQIDGNPEDLGLDLLSAFFIAHHHGGDLHVQKQPEPPGFVLQLPYDPDLVKRPALEVDRLDKILTRFNDMESSYNALM